MDTKEIKYKFMMHRLLRCSDTQPNSCVLTRVCTYRRKLLMAKQMVRNIYIQRSVYIHTDTYLNKYIYVKENTYIDRLLLIRAPSWDQTHNPGMCPDWNRARDLPLCGMKPNQAGQGERVIFKKINVAVLTKSIWGEINIDPYFFLTQKSIPHESDLNMKDKIIKHLQHK